MFPDGCTSVACVRARDGASFVALVGPRAAELRPPVSPGVRIWGIRFWPDVVTAVLGVPAAQVRDWFGPVPLAAASRFAGLAGALPDSDDPDVVFPALDEWASPFTRPLPHPDARIRSAVRAIVARRGEGALASVAMEACLGVRQLQRLFPKATGLTLREYARVRRLREALAMRLQPAEPRWSSIAAGTGFVDHAHLTREFIALTGIAPSRAARQLRSTAHGAIRP